MSSDMGMRRPLSSLPVCDRLKAVLGEKLHIATLTAIQTESIPMLLSGRDTLIQSQTGSGKTLCYLVPLLEQLQAHKTRVGREQGTRALILLPTRELCTQVLEVLQQVVAPFHWLVTGSLMGGEKKKAEKARLRKGVPIVVATPGRLVDHLKNTECFTYKHLEWLVLDEADRLLDLGFEKDLTFVVQKLRAATRGFQTVLASATLTEGVERLAQVSLVDPHRAGYGDKKKGDSIEGSLVGDVEQMVPSTLKQSYVTVDSRNRLSTLGALLRCKLFCEQRKVLVFLSTCDSVDFHHELFRTFPVPQELGGKNSLAASMAAACGLDPSAFGGSATAGKLAGEQKRKPRTAAEKRKGISGKLKKKEAAPAADGGDEEEDLMVGVSGAQVFRLHGQMPQKDRAASFKGFTANSCGVLFCTDVAARGLDIKGVDWIVQYDPPNEPADYIHRIGRTARAGRGGDALLFLQQCEESYAELLELKGLPRLSRANGGDYFMTAFPPKGQDQPHRDPRLIEMACQRAFEQRMIATAWQAFLRAYQTHSKETRKSFQVKKLHLGHVAKSFGLKETPSKVASKAKERANTHSRGADSERKAATWREEGVGLDKRIGKGGKAFKTKLQNAKRKVRAEGMGVVEDGKLTDGPRRKKRPKIGVVTSDYSGEFAN